MVDLRTTGAPRQSDDRFARLLAVVAISVLLTLFFMLSFESPDRPARDFWFQSALFVGTPLVLFVVAVPMTALAAWVNGCRSDLLRRSALAAVTPCLLVLPAVVVAGELDRNGYPRIAWVAATWIVLVPQYAALRSVFRAGPEVTLTASVCIVSAVAGVLWLILAPHLWS